jgi:hypothetical protein
LCSCGRSFICPRSFTTFAPQATVTVNATEVFCLERLCALGFPHPRFGPLGLGPQNQTAERGMQWLPPAHQREGVVVPLPLAAQRRLRQAPGAHQRRQNARPAYLVPGYYLD